MDDEPTYVKVPKPAAAAFPVKPVLSAPSPSPPGRDAKSDSAAALSTDTKSGAAISSQKSGPAPDSQEFAELVMLYSLKSGGGFGGGSKYKHLQNYINSTVSRSASNTSTGMIAMLQGANYNNRLGAGIKLKHMTLRGTFRWSDQSTSQFFNPLLPVRMIVFVDKMPLLGTTPWSVNSTSTTDFTAMCNTLGIASTTDYNTTAMFNYNTHGFRYKILHDETYFPRTPTASMVALGATISGTSTVGIREFVHHIDLGGLPIQYPDPSTGNPSVNNLEVILITDTNAAATGITPANVYYGLLWDVAFEDDAY